MLEISSAAEAAQIAQFAADAPIIVVWTPGDWIMVITAIFTGVNTVIAATAAAISTVNYNRGKRNETALTAIKAQTDGMSTKLQDVARQEGFQDAKARGEDIATAVQTEHERRTHDELVQAKSAQLDRVEDKLDAVIPAAKV